jgi:hypothetical protein
VQAEFQKNAPHLCARSLDIQGSFEEKVFQRDVESPVSAFGHYSFQIFKQRMPARYMNVRGKASLAASGFPNRR